MPVCIYNNTQGDADARWLRTFEEAAWNNPVVRIVDQERQDLVPRIHNDWSRAALLQGMTAALKEPPAWLVLLRDEAIAEKRGVATAVFGMHCYWVGEEAFGAMTGVVATQAGFIGKDEVVAVTFDPKVLSYEALVKRAREQDCASKVFVRNEAQWTAAKSIFKEGAERSTTPVRPAKDTKHALSQTLMRHLPLTPMQAARLNAAVKTGLRKDWLSPGQRALLERIEARPDAPWPVVLNQPFASAAEAVRRFDSGR